MKKTVFKSKKQAGMTLIELMVVLVIGVILVYFIYPIARGWFETANRANLTSARDSYMQCINERLTSYSDTTGMNNDWAISRGCISASRVVGANMIKNSIGGTTTLSAATLTVANDAISMSDTGISTTLCTTYAADKNDIYDSISINGTVVKALGGTLNDATVTASCQQSASNNTVTFIKKKN
ncbi:type 4 pilus major pilin [Chromobacterium vaccinii]|uniref:type 4 pilus major pilin n=1 Tax=Chromobacterium vaccinii TaxID=1108595 RepID=UPI003457DC61